MDKAEIYAFLNQKGIPFEITEHKAVYNMAEAMELQIPYPEADAKNLFLRDDKKRNYYLLTVKGDKRAALKIFRKDNGTRPLSFASADDLKEILGLTPGAVTPLGLLNDKECRVAFYLDDYFVRESSLIGCHPNDNTATVWLQTSDLLKLIEEHGNSIHVVKMD